MQARRSQIQEKVEHRKKQQTARCHVQASSRQAVQEKLWPTATFPEFHNLKGIPQEKSDLFARHS